MIDTEIEAWAELDAVLLVLHGSALPEESRMAVCDIIEATQDGSTIRFLLVHPDGTCYGFVWDQKADLSLLSTHFQESIPTGGDDWPPPDDDGVRWLNS